MDSGVRSFPSDLIRSMIGRRPMRNRTGLRTQAGHLASPSTPNRQDVGTLDSIPDRDARNGASVRSSL
jgi:hypothetical protein